MSFRLADTKHRSTRTELSRGDPSKTNRCPATLALLDITNLTILGDLALLNQMVLALFCSVQCPSHIILKLHARAHELAAAGAGLISPFHSPLEQQALTILLRSQGHW